VKRFVGSLRKLGFKYQRTNTGRGFFGIEAKPEPARPWTDEN